MSKTPTISLEKKERNDDLQVYKVKMENGTHLWVELEGGEKINIYSTSGKSSITIWDNNDTMIDVVTERKFKIKKRFRVKGVLNKLYEMRDD